MAFVSTSCRICLKESLESYFEMNQQCVFSIDNQNFSDIFNFCTHIQVQMSDELPQRICIVCAQDLEKTYAFLQRVLASNRKLIDLKKICNDNDSVRDPLENVTDNEDALHKNGIKSETDKQNDKDEYSSASCDNTLEVSQLNDNLAFLLSDSEDDKNNVDFFKSVESQIFPQGRFKCKICGIAYFTTVGLQTHMDIHLPKRKYIPKASVFVDKYIKKKKKVKADDISDDENFNDQSMKLAKDKNIMKERKPKKMFPCEVCGKQMISASKLRYHMLMHTGEKDYLCTMCPKAYSTIYALKHHMRAHTGERPYECKFCGDRFLRPTTLKSHMRRHTGERPYGCDICGKRFIQHSSMATHMKLNHMDKTIHCPYCDKKYARQTDLNTHLLSHSGDKPFACQICPSRFTRQSNLNKHTNQYHSSVSLLDKKIKTSKIIDKAVQSFENTDSSTPCVYERPSSSSNLK